MYMIKLQWKDFSIDLEALNKKLKKDYPSYVGNQAHSHLELWFSEEPSQEDQEAIQEMWDKLRKSSAIAKSYQSLADREAAKQVELDAEQAELDAKKEAVKTKLLALGLTEDELSVLLK